MMRQFFRLAEASFAAVAQHEPFPSTWQPYWARSMYPHDFSTQPEQALGSLNASWQHSGQTLQLCAVSPHL